MKEMLILKASEDISNSEIENVASQSSLYGIKTEIVTVDSLKSLVMALNTDKKFDYIYLATHGCESYWGDISGSVKVGWVPFAALICSSSIANPGAVFLHSCCRGGLSQVAYQMFACCPSIEFVCGPRHNVTSVDLITVFNLFLYNIETKHIDPVRAAEKVLAATDIRLACYDRIETCCESPFLSHKSQIEGQIESAFANISYDEKTLKIDWIGGEDA